jgi:hypothetical protein
MSLASLAAAATVFDTIEEVAADTGIRASMARVTLVQRGIASVDDDGGVTMSERQSRVAASCLFGAELG